jgi:release factor glutamine methyltransferase
VDNRTIKAFLRPGGWLLLEHGWQQGEAVRALFGEQGYVQVETCRDYGDNERLTLGRLPQQE